MESRNDGRYEISSKYISRDPRITKGRNDQIRKTTTGVTDSDESDEDKYLRSKTYKWYYDIAALREAEAVKSKGKRWHKYYVMSAVANVLFCAGKFTFNVLSIEGKLFRHRTKDLIHIYYGDLTLEDWVYAAATFIVVYEWLWTFYSLTFIYSHKQLYIYPIPISVLIINSFACFLNVMLLVCLDRQELVLTFAGALVYSLMYYVMLGLAYRALYRVSPKLHAKRRYKDILWTRALFHNGLAMTTTWVTMTTLVVLSMMLHFTFDISTKDAASIALGVLSAEMVLFAVVDLFFLDRYSRYVFTPYIIFAVTLMAAPSKNYTRGERNSLLTLFLLCTSIFLLLVKMFLSFTRNVKDLMVSFVTDSLCRSSR